MLYQNYKYLLLDVRVYIFNDILTLFSGIGREIAKALCKGGANVYGLSRTKELLDTLKEEVRIKIKYNYNVLTELRNNYNCKYVYVIIIECGKGCSV